jgi:hypothetical protein
VNPTSPSEITELLHAWSAGNQDAYNQIVETVYPELRKIAQRCLRGERPQHTIQATALVHEAYLRLIDIQQIPWQDRLTSSRSVPESCATFWSITPEQGIPVRSKNSEQTEQARYHGRSK